MRITMTEEYENHRLLGSCPYGILYCDGHYCEGHRLLYQFCETAIKTHLGSGEIVYEERECPKCVMEARYAAN